MDIDDISFVGDTDPTTPLLCHTNKPAIGAHSSGDWISPSGVIVGGINTATVPGFGRNRGPMLVRLWRTTASTSPPVEGIYRCEVIDAGGTLQTVYVGLYNENGGGNVLYM